MKGQELIDLIQNNCWQDLPVWISVDGKVKNAEELAPLFSSLANTNEVVIKDHIDMNHDEEFWKSFYGTYMDIISKEEADAAVKAGNPCFYILYCDGTEGLVDSNLTPNQWKVIKSWGVMFGYEK